jgi:hypothetical protein
MNKHHLETTDLFKGAFFLCMGGSLTCLRVEYNGRQTATFLITGDDLDRHNADYMTGRALVNPMQLKNSLNHLRDQLFNKLREKENRDHDDIKENRAKTNRRHQNPNRHHRAY